MVVTHKMATRRKHREVTLKVKFEALKELEKGRQNKDVAKQYGIPGSTLATWKKNKENIFDAFENSSLKRYQNRNIQKVERILVKVVYIDAW